MQRIAVQLAPAAPVAYEALVEPGLLERCGEWIRPHLPAGGRAVIVTNPLVRRLWAQPVEASLAAAGLEPIVIEMPDGEPFKRVAELERLAETMVAAGAGRDALVIALGGGVVGDVAALLASVYMRGVALVQIPTTLLAMIDSSLGGKTGVDLAGGKNLVGTFYHPRAILVDPQVLSTLAPRQVRSGMAEAVKYGMIGDLSLFERIERSPQETASPEMIAACLAQKAAVVEADEREGGLRQILNFGHTLGHALESATGYRHFLHGEAVAWGMIAAGDLAVRLGRFDAAAAARMNVVILAACAPLPTIELAAEEILRHAASDKKARAGVLRFILPTDIGSVEVVKDVPRSAILEALDATVARSQAIR